MWYESDKNTLFLGVTHHNTGLTPKKVLLATETQRKTENIDDIYFRTDFGGVTMLCLVQNCPSC